MSDFNPHSLLLIHRIPEGRRQRLARVRTVALIVISLIAVSGVVLHDRGSHHPSGAQIASAHEPFSYFPG